MLAVTWRGDVLKWVQAAGGAESDADAIYDAFHALLKKSKAAAKKAKGGGGARDDLTKYRSMGFQVNLSA